MLVCLGTLLKDNFKILSVDFAMWTMFVNTAILFSTFGCWSRPIYEDEASSGVNETQASIFSRLTFVWITPLVKLGWKKHLEQEDLWELSRMDAIEPVLEDYSRISKKWPLWVRIIILSKWYFAYQMSAALAGTVLSFASPYYLYQVIEQFRQDSFSRGTVLIELLSLFSCNCLKSILDGITYHNGRRVAMRARSVIVDELYAKSLQRRPFSDNENSDIKEHTSLGKIVTLMSVDAERIRKRLTYLHRIAIDLPISLFIGLFSLFSLLGWSATVGLLIMVISVPISTYLGKTVMMGQKKYSSFTDKRIELINELLQGIRVVKYFAWDKQFLQKIDTVRENELKAMVRLWGAFIGLNIVGNSSGIIIAVCTFTVFSLAQGENLNSAVAFTAINLLRTMTYVISALPRLLMRFLQAKVSFDRIDDFLNEDDLPQPKVINEPGSNEQVNIIGFNDADFGYYFKQNHFSEAQNSNGFKLKNLNLRFPSGKLSVIAGPIGAGKSSLLCALLGEMEVLKGEYFLPISDGKVDPKSGLSQSVAYGAQTVWLLNATIRENIVFGSHFESERYEKVLRDCALQSDLESLPGGDLTEIGERGINLSGGQKQRISLARACYSRAKIVLLDDILSAVDSPTARYLLHKCLLGLLKGRTVILITHATALVAPFADYIVYMENGQVIAADTPNALQGKQLALDIPDLILEKGSFDDVAGYKHSNTNLAKVTGNGTVLVEKETKSSGSVRLEVYRSYLIATGGILFCILFFGLNLFQWITQIGNDFWLKNWTDHNEQSTAHFSGKYLLSFYLTMKNAVSKEADSTWYYVGIYGLLGMLVIVTNISTTVLMLYGQLRASRVLHEKLLKRILGAPLRFFETTPVGRILNRFSSDMESVDGNGLDSIMSFMFQVIGTFVTLILIGVVSPYFLLLAPFILVSFAHIANLYRTTSRELKRFAAITTSPVYAQFSETLNGISTIRAYSANQRFVKRCHKSVNENHKPDFLLWALNRWLAIRMDFIAACAVLLSGVSILFVDISAGLAAMIISYSMDMTQTLLWSVRLHAEMEISMNAGKQFLHS